jgi:EmrB/QacA subfamily drug resistance transporter
VAAHEIPQLTALQRKLAVGAIGCAMVLELLDMTILNVALPTLRASFCANEAQIQWMVAGYTTVFALLLITGGRLGDIYGYKKMLIAGMAGFTLSSMLCGLALTPDVLVAARLLQGLSGALMVPQGTSLIQVMFAPHERLKPLSLFGMLGGLATMLGPIVGGAIIGANIFGLSWRPAFFINLPVGLIAIAIGVRVLPEGRSPHAPTLDWTGVALSTATLFALLFPLIQGAHTGWPWWSVLLLVSAAPLALVLVWHSHRLGTGPKSPLLTLSLFQVLPFRVGLAVTLINQMAATGFIFILAIVLQTGLGMSPTMAGFAHMPLALAIALGIGVLARRWLPKLGPKMITIGAGVMALGLGLLGMIVMQMGATYGGAPVSAALFVVGFGMGMILGPLPPCTLSDVDVAHAGAASGLLKTTQQLGNALGVAMIGTLFFTLSGDGAPASVVHGFAQTLLGIAALIGATGLMALAIPGDLRLLRPHAAPPLSD